MTVPTLHARLLPVAIMVLLLPSVAHAADPAVTASPAVGSDAATTSRHR